MNKREFVTGTPGPDVRVERTLADALADSRRAIKKKRTLELRKRLYSSPLTDRIRRANKRMIGEGNEDE